MPLATDPVVTTYMITTTAARAALKELTSRRIHPHFSAYLASLKALHGKGASVEKIPFQSFFQEYLSFSGGKPAHPYLIPFSESGKGSPDFLNKNVAGSYAPSSLRDVAPIRKVISFSGKGQDTKHSLLAEHEKLALENLCYGQKVPALSLGIFLLRDHSISGNESSQPADIVVSEFCRTFHYDLSVAEEKERFELLYEIDSQRFDGIQILEKIG